MNGFEFTIPLNRDMGVWPVSVNAMTRRGSDGRPKLAHGARIWRQTVEGEAWLAWQQLDAAARSALETAGSWRIGVTLDWGRWHAQRQDADNVLKLILDGLKRGTGIDDRVYVPATKVVGPSAGASLVVTVTAGDGEEE